MASGDREAARQRMRQAFVQYDEELQDSDQTISGRVSRTGGRRVRLATAADVSSGDDSARRRVTAGRRQCHPPSAFFSDTTDDDTTTVAPAALSRSTLSMSAHGRMRGAKREVSAPLHRSVGPSTGSMEKPRDDQRLSLPRLHLDAIQFPVTRSVLWDRRQLSTAPISVALEQVLPHFVLSADALKQLHRLQQERTASGAARDAVLCYLYGNVLSSSPTKVKLDGIAIKKSDARAAGTWCVPVRIVPDTENQQQGMSQENYASTIAALLDRYRDEYADDVASKLQPSMLLFNSSSRRHAANLDFQLECAAPPVLLKLSLVRNLPLLMTPLAASLARREFGTTAETRRCGYITLDRTRKAVPLLKVDPLVLQQPIVGVWAYGVQIDDEWDETSARRQLADPFLYFACVDFLMSRAIKERVGPAKNTFLVALYPARDTADGSPVSSLPRFFECSVSEYLSPPDSPLPMELYAHRRSSLVGVSSFVSDVEMTLSASPTPEWEAARRQMQIPTAPRRAEESDEPSESNASLGSRAAESEEKEEPAGNFRLARPDAAASARGTVDLQPRGGELSIRDKERTTENARADGASAGGEPEVLSDSESDGKCASNQSLQEQQSVQASQGVTDSVTPHQDSNGNTNGDNYRSCCKSQQLLTIQHQQILENQQRQLHEMQEQIAQLRRLLDSARNECKPVSVDANEDAYHSDASSSSIGAVGDVSGEFVRRDGGFASSRASQLSAAGSSRRGDGSPTRALSDTTSVILNEGDAGDETAGRGNDVSVSSLGLSSISNHSVGSELSSLSSSIVGKHSTEHDELEDGKDNPDDTNADGTRAGDLSRSQLSETGSRMSTRAGRTVNLDTEVRLGQGEGCLETEPVDAGELSSVQDKIRAIEMSTAPQEEAARTAVMKDTKLKSDDESAERDRGEAETSDEDRLVIERLLEPDSYLRKNGGLVDHHGGCFTTPPLDFHSFCVPRIKFASDPPGCSLSDSEDEEIRLIEQKYKRLMAA